MSGDVRVLLVDADEEWVTLTGKLLERVDHGLTVTTATDVREATATLDLAPPDCIVSEYEMPDVGGLTFLETVREAHPDVPFILVASSGSEGVASEAISLGVTDCFVKQYGTDQSTVLATRIRNAVEVHRAERALRESEERYRTLVEQSRDAIYIYADDRIRFINRQGCELVGYPAAELYAMSNVFGHLIHPDDRERLEDIERRRFGDGASDPPTRYEARLLTRDGDVRHCEFHVNVISYEGRDATLGSIRDVTERKEREQALRTERDMHEAFRGTLVRSSSRIGVETAFCEQVVDDDRYAFAWVGVPVSRRSLAPRAWAGEGRGYVDRIDLAGGGDVAEPSVTAMDTREVQVVRDVAEESYRPWQSEAARCGFRAVAAVPLVHRDVPHGVFSVYASEPDAFDDHELRILTDLAETLAYAIHAAEGRRALTADHVTRVELAVADDAHPLVNLTMDPELFGSDGEIRVDGVVAAHEGAVLAYATVVGATADAISNRCARQPAIREVRASESEAGSCRVEFVVEGPTPSSTLADGGAEVRDVRVADGEARVVAHFHPDTPVREVIDRVFERYPGATVVSQRTIDRARGTRNALSDLVDDSLTDKQEAALRAAYLAGYFESPREHSSEDVAASLGVSRSTFLEHLRLAEEKVFAGLFDG